MSFLSNIYHASIAETEKNIRFWEDYLQQLKSLDLNTFADKLRVPVMVPIGSRILFRGELKHTNEITISLGADYFAKCSVKQAEVLRQHRIKDAESKLCALKKEKEYIENQTVLFRSENIFDDQGQEIVETYSEDGEKVWREKHKQNIKQWKQKKNNDEKQNEITDEELWNRLEELELQEELENELKKDANVASKKGNNAFFTVKEESSFDKEAIDSENTEIKFTVDSKEMKTANVESQRRVKFAESVSEVEKKDDILLKVREKQNELEKALLELRNQERGKSKTQEDLIAKLDELDKLEELQDEMERLEDIIETEIVTSEEELLEEESMEDTSEPQPINLKRKVSFADQDDSETLEITFNHSDNDVSTAPYDPTIGITKPGDIYAAFSNIFTETTSILKKTKYEKIDSNVKLLTVETNIQGNKTVEPLEERYNLEEKIIVVKDVVEKENGPEKNVDHDDKRPISLFKQRRQQRKT